MMLAFYFAAACKVRYVMPRTSLAAAVLLLAFSCSAFAEPEVLGYFEVKSDLGGARNRFCVERGDSGQLSVAIATAYCPSKECMNARLDGMQFQAPLKSDQLIYTKKSGCTVRIRFYQGRARVWRNTSSCDDEHPYFYAEGWYKFVSSTPDRSRC
jgi:hypothetical protein